jgi:hypothetical protein
LLGEQAAAHSEASVPYRAVRVVGRWGNPAMSGEDGVVEIGESSAYRALGIDPLVEVRVLRIGTTKP